ncbi:MAG: hypothetical protein JWL92_368 [Candidatus Nomurabacteria bacterium]|nr:hypothetical protein [Candidatus Nomurabacteria bacterium]
MNKLSTLDWLALILLIVGGLNWLLIGFFNFDLVAAIFGSMTTISNIIYAVVGLATVYVIFLSGKLMKR